MKRPCCGSLKASTSWECKSNVSRFERVGYLSCFYVMPILVRKVPSDGRIQGILCVWFDICILWPIFLSCFSPRGPVV